MPSLRDAAPDGVLCTFRNRSAPDRDMWCGPLGQAAWTVHHVQNHTLMGHSPPASQAGRRVGPALYSLRPLCCHLLPETDLLTALVYADEYF